MSFLTSHPCDLSHSAIFRLLSSPSSCPESVRDQKSPQTGYNTKNSLDHIFVANWSDIWPTIIKVLLLSPVSTSLNHIASVTGSHLLGLWMSQKNTAKLQISPFLKQKNLLRRSAFLSPTFFICCLVPFLKSFFVFLPETWTMCKEMLRYTAELRPVWPLRQKDLMITFQEEENPVLNKGGGDSCFHVCPEPTAVCETFVVHPVTYRTFKFHLKWCVTFG